MIDSRLLLNGDKTEFLVIGTRKQLNKLSPLQLQVGDQMIDPSLNVRNLGFFVDNSLSMNTHINGMCKAAFYPIHNIRRVANKCLQTLVHASVTSRSDYCNSLLYGLPKYQASVVQTMDSAIPRINHYPADKH